MPKIALVLGGALFLFLGYTDLGRMIRATSQDARAASLAALLVSVREQRAAAAQTVTGRIAQRALTRLESQFGSTST